MKKIVFQQSYDGESVVDLPGDACEALDEQYNAEMRSIPTDEHGLSTGKFTVTIEWEGESP